MPAGLQAHAQWLRALRDAAVRLADDVKFLGLPPPSERHWFQVLEHKLLPQLTGQPWLVVAVVGGTNIGKSAIFNHLAGENASAVSPLAARTRHPVCLVPPQFNDESRLQELFQGFELHAWHSADDPLCDAAQDRLYWRVSPRVPPKLLLLDTPDVDSTAEVNWDRAEHIRQTADVLIAILTQQKYNDAAVKRFFRQAAAARQEVIVVFNQCDLVHDRAWWPRWLETFVEETGIEPTLVYVVPADREACKQLRLPFYRVGNDGEIQSGVAGDLRDELAQLHFDAIKLRTLRGALDELRDGDRGIPAFCHEIRAASEPYRRAMETLWTDETAQDSTNDTPMPSTSTDQQDAQLAHAVVQIENWPSIPDVIFRNEVREWMSAQRPTPIRFLHHVYHYMNPLEWVRWMRRRSTSAEHEYAQSYVKYEQDEEDAVQSSAEQLVKRLEKSPWNSHDAIGPILRRQLAGDNCTKLTDMMKVALRMLPPVKEEFSDFVGKRLSQWALDNPGKAITMRIVDGVLVASPVITVALVGAGELLLAAVAWLAGSAGDTGSEGAIRLLFNKIRLDYAKQRYTTPTNQLNDWLKPLRDDLRRGAEVCQSPAWGDFEQAFQHLQEAQPDRSPA